MAELHRCNELRHSCCSNEWEDMFMLYCRRAATEDSSLVGEINRLCDKLTSRIEEREYFIDELDLLVDSFVPEKMAEFLKETQEKDKNRLMKLFLKLLVGSSRSMAEDYRIAGDINRVAIELNNVIVQKDRFLEELDSLGVWHVPSKMAEFMREIQAKDKETVEKLRILQREMELNARDSSANKALFAVCVIVSFAGSGVSEDWALVMPALALNDAGNVWT
ncbi:hypothetical protein Tco_1267376 [Tanacetum coccineum]